MLAKRVALRPLQKAKAPYGSALRGRTEQGSVGFVALCALATAEAEAASATPKSASVAGLGTEVAMKVAPK
jgi:hypothetical protein